MDDEEKREKLVRKLAKAEKLRMRELERKEKELEKDLLKAFSP